MSPLSIKLYTNRDYKSAKIMSTAFRINKVLVRQAQLGASYRVPCLCNKAGSPHRVKLNQQPVPSVARLAESDSMANNSREAYTGNTVGRRGGVPPRSNSAPLGVNTAVGDGFNVPEACTQGSYW